MSSSLCLPPAPNWYSLCILDSSPGGLLAYGAKNHLVVVRSLAVPQGSERDNWRNETEQDRQFPQVHVTYQAHSEKAKLSCVCWCPSPEYGPGGQNVMSAADDGSVRVWRWAEGKDTEDQKLKLMGQHSLHAEEGRSRVTAASWSAADPSVIVTADDNGLLVVWDLTTNGVRSLNYGKNTIYSVSCHPNNPDVVAFGCKLGLVFIVSLSGTGRVIHRMRGHDEDVFCVRWCPEEDVQVAGDRLGQQERVLASASRDKTVRLWASVAGRAMSTVKLPGGYSRGKGGGGQQSWVSCCWASGSVLLTSGVGGELLRWDLAKPSNKGGFEWEQLHKEHNRTLFSIAVHGDLVYTVGQDRAVVCHTVTQGKLYYSLPTFAGFVYCLAVNPIDPSIIAIGGGDGQIRIWRTGSPSLFDVTYLWQKLNQSKIYSLAWHPHKEGLLAYGTDEGRVGWFEAFSNGKPPVVSSYQHRGGVYSVTWGPVVSGGEDLGLYSCGDGQVMLHSLKQGGKPLDVQELLTEKNPSEGKAPGKKSQVVWRKMGEKSLLGLGCEDGTIEIYLIPELELVATLRTHTKLIQALAWHPTHLAAGQPSKHPGWLATASNLNTIHVFDLANLLVHNDEDVEPVVLVSPDIELEGHLQRVIELDWSPHKDGLLVSVSYDFSGQVWDVEKRTPIHNFQGHSGRLMCCMWHPTLEGLVLTGAEDFTLHGWWPKDQPGERPVDRRRQKKEKREVAWAEREVKEEKDSQELSFDELLKKHKMEQAKKSNQGENGTGDRENSVDKEEVLMKRNERGDGGTARTIEAFDQVQKEKRKRNNQTRSLFPLSSKAEGSKSLTKETVEDCILLAKVNKKIENGDSVSTGVDVIKDLADNLAHLKMEEVKSIGKGNQIHLGYFHDRSALLGMLSEEREQLETEGCATLDLWQGDLGAVLKQAAAVGQLSEKLVGMAAGVSQVAWREAALAFAHQLNKEGQYTKASDYYLAVHDIYSAVEVLRKNGYFRAAISVARCRLAPDDPVIGQVLGSWAKQCSGDGNYKLAAKCWVAAGKFGEGAEILAKVGQTGTSRGAAWLAGAAGDTTRQAVYTAQCLTGCLLEEDWATGSLLAQDDPSMAWAGLLMMVHQAVTKVVAGKGDAGEPLLRILAKTAEDRQINLKDGSAVENITKFMQSTAKSKEEKKLAVTVSCRLGLSLLSLSNTKDCLSHVASALAGCHSHPQLLASLVGACLPAGTTPPEVGKATVGVPLDWQCQWHPLRSIQVSEAMLVLGGGGKDPELSQESAEEVADVFMQEDVIYLQKLQAEVEEAEIEIRKITDKNGQVNGMGDAVNGTEDKHLVEAEPSKNKDITKPPTAASPSFAERFIEGREDTTEALKEYQKLKWLLSRTSVPDAPFPNLSDCCKRLVILLEEAGLGEDPPMEGEELPEVEGMEILGSMPGRKEEELGLRKRLARWGFHHGERTYQVFFLEHC